MSEQRTLQFENPDNSSDDLTQNEIQLQDDQFEERQPSFANQLNNSTHECFDLNLVDNKSLILNQKPSGTHYTEGSPYLPASINQNIELKSENPQQSLDVSKGEPDEQERTSYVSNRDIQNESFKTAKPSELTGAGEEEDEEKNIDISQDIKRYSFSLGAERMGPSFDGLNLLNWNEPSKNPDTFQKSLELYANHNLSSTQVEFGLDYVKEPADKSKNIDLMNQSFEQQTQQQEHQVQHELKDHSFDKKYDLSDPIEFKTDLTLAHKNEEKSINISAERHDENKESMEEIYRPLVTKLEDTLTAPRFSGNKVQSTFETQTCFDDIPTGKIMYPQFKKPIKDISDEQNILTSKDMQTPEEYDRLHGLGGDDDQFVGGLRSLTRETQTQEDNFYQSEYLSFFDNNRDTMQITIPNITYVKDGYVTGYNLYEINVKGQDREYTVHRRFDDFVWLYNELSSNYIGYIVPIHPEKNIWTKINQESSEFSEKRKTELSSFLKKLVNHKILHRTIEFHKFLLDQHAFHDYKNSKPTKDSDIFGIVSKAVYQGFSGRRRAGPAEPTSEETMIQNFDFYLDRLERFIQDMLQHLRNYGDLKRKHSAEILNTSNLILKILEMDKTYISKPSLLDIGRLSDIEDKNNKNLLKDIEPFLKEILINLASARAAIAKRQEGLNELYEIEEEIINFNINIKKENRIDASKLELLKRDASENQKKLQTATGILVQELTNFKQDLEKDLDTVFLTLKSIQTSYFSKLFELWKAADIQENNKITLSDKLTF